MASKRALVTGITGQDGSYLAELLVGLGYEVHGLLRPQNGRGVLDQVPGLSGNITCHEACVEDFDAVAAVTSDVHPDECYHLAAQTFIGTNYTNEFATLRTNATGTHHVLASLREHAPQCRLFVAGSSEMFGDVHESPQTETTQFQPRTIYGVSKLTGYHLMRLYREADGLFACCGILYNHESPRRGRHFVTRKITSSAVRIRAGLQSELRLGNLDALRDWGHARDYVYAMWLMLQQSRPDDYILATGIATSVRRFAEVAFQYVGLDWKDYVISDPQFYRPAEVYPLIGSSEKALRQLGWAPRYSFEALVQEMVACDRAELEAQLSNRTSDSQL